MISYYAACSLFLDVMTIFSEQPNMLAIEWYFLVCDRYSIAHDPSAFISTYLGTSNAKYSLKRYTREVRNKNEKYLSKSKNGGGMRSYFQQYNLLFLFTKGTPTAELFISLWKQNLRGLNWSAVEIRIHVSSVLTAPHYSAAVINELCE